MKRGFTLAEVLITLGIIGVIAAMTIPALIASHRKHEVETKLAKFYSVTNQAIKLSTVEYGEPAEWGDWDCGTSSSPTCSIDEAIEKFNKYIGKNLQIMEIKKADDENSFYIYLNDGGIIQWYVYLYDLCFYTNKKATGNSQMGINTFSFRFSPKNATGNDPNNPVFKYTINPTLEPYTYSWDGTMEGLTDISNPYACGGTYSEFCTKLIQLYGWKIPKDYPFKF
ncbi:MAG: type II secretion system protein [Candidatus Gastranaerophilaceae bacterium]|nr:type II secretion system protein [Candidatus Gastranaerophilaceae bacterium]